MAGELPIDAIRSAFAAASAQPRPVVVAAPTGSGKSTRLPGWMAQDTGGRVLVVEPRRVACRALATWLSGDEPLGRTFGYRVRFEDRASDRTQVVFVTPGVALGMLASGEIDRYRAVLVDEFHERGWEVDLAVALLRDALGRGDAPRLALCSATLDTDALCERLGATLVKSEGRSFPVGIEYDGDGPPSARDLEDAVARAVRRALGRDEGDVLVFLPGKGEIERCAAALSNIDARCIPLHGGLPPEKLTRALAPAAQRRVFLATNVAETSLTVPGVTTVIDGGLARMRHHQAGRAVLAVVPISRASMDQRAGRAGRVAPGRCIRLFSASFEPVEVTPPEIERMDLDDVVLRAAACGLSGARFDHAPWVTPPPSFAVEEARARLREAGALTEDGTISGTGRAQAALPVSWLGAKILADAPPGLAGVLADLVALVEVRRSLLLDVDPRDIEVHDARRSLFEGATDEVSAALRCLWRGDAKRHGLHRGALTEARKLAAALRRRVGARERASEGARVDLELVSHVLKRVPEAAFVRRPRADRKSGGKRGPSSRSSSEPWGNGRSELQLRPYRVPGLNADEQPKPPVAGIVLDDEWLGVGRGAKGVGRMLLRCRLEDLVAAGLGELEVGEPRLVRPSGSRGLERAEVVAGVVRRYAGVELERTEASLQGEALARALATLIVRGSLRKGLADLLEDDLHLWRVLRAWVAAHGPGDASRIAEAPIDVHAYLAERLGQHGVERPADVELLEDEDLRPDLEPMALEVGVGPTELRRLGEDFPRRWIIPGGVYACTLDVPKRLVVVEPIEQHAKGDPPAKFLPRFRGFAVEYRKASRRLRLR